MMMLVEEDHRELQSETVIKRDEKIQMSQQAIAGSNGKAAKPGPIKVNLMTASALLEETINVMKKCKQYENELEKRDIVIQKAIMHMSENRNSNPQSQINKFVQNLLEAEVPRLILKEYDNSRLQN